MKDAERGEPIRGVEAANTTSLSIEAINGVPKPDESDWSGTLRWISCWTAWAAIPTVARPRPNVRYHSDSGESAIVSNQADSKSQIYRHSPTSVRVRCGNQKRSTPGKQARWFDVQCVGTGRAMWR